MEVEDEMEVEDKFHLYFHISLIKYAFQAYFMDWGEKFNLKLDVKTHLKLNLDLI